MPVQITPQKLMELLGSLYAEVRVLTEENTSLREALGEALNPPQDKK